MRWESVVLAADHITRDGIQDGNEHKEIRDLCMNATPHQRAYIYNSLKAAGYSDATLCYFLSSAPTSSPGKPYLIWVNA
jgi:hypothetical protein